jgi:hypothetical protein
MDRLRISSMTAALGICLVLTFGFYGCASKAGAPEVVNCPASISWEVAPEAQLTQFDCTMGIHGGQTSLIFDVGLMNVTDQPHRYRVNVFLEDMDKAVGALIPRKGKPPVVEPGKTATAKMPFIGTEGQSKKISVLVKTISYE